jgi:hypothetical protein
MHRFNVRVIVAVLLILSSHVLEANLSTSLNSRSHLSGRLAGSAQTCELAGDVAGPELPTPAKLHSRLFG